MEGGGGLTSILDEDIIRTHILTRLDAMSLASAAATCSRLHELSSDEELWANVCHSTWPSTRSPIVRHLMRRFPQGSRSFFCDASMRPEPIDTTRRPMTKRMIMDLEKTPRLISAVDLYYKGRRVASRVGVTETVSEGFRGERLRLEIGEEEVGMPSRPPALIYLKSDKEVREAHRWLSMSWTVIDASGRRAISLLGGEDVRLCGMLRMSGHHVVWLRGRWEMEGKGEWYRMSVMLTLEAKEGEEMKLKEGWLGMEDMFGRDVKGRDGLVILQRAFQSPRETLQGRRERHHASYRMRMRMRMRMRVRSRGGWFYSFYFYSWDLLIMPLLWMADNIYYNILPLI